jgi:hypothetical protein
MPKAKSKKREKSQMEIVTTKPQNSKGPLKGKTSRKRANPDKDKIQKLQQDLLVIMDIG